MYDLIVNGEKVRSEKKALFLKNDFYYYLNNGDKVWLERDGEQVYFNGKKKVEKTTLQDYKRALTKFRFLVSDRLMIGSYIEPDNYCIMFLDSEGRVKNWFAIDDKETMLFLRKIILGCE